MGIGASGSVGGSGGCPGGGGGTICIHSESGMTTSFAAASVALNGGAGDWFSLRETVTDL
jgi:hypothetical protein